MELIKKGDPRLKPFEDNREAILLLMNTFNCSVSEVYIQSAEEEKENKRKDTIYIGGVNNDYNPIKR